MASMNTPQRSSPPPLPPKKMNGRVPKPPPPVKKVTFSSDLPIEQAAYEGAAKVLGYEPILYPYVDEAYAEVSRKHAANIEALRELSRE